MPATSSREACFQVPAWHRMLWGEHAARAGGEVVRVSATGDAKAAGFADGYLPELFHRLYADIPAEIPAAERGPAAALRGRLHALASELPEFRTLRTQTVHDPLWSGMAATALGSSVAAALPARSQSDPPPDGDAADRILDGMRDLVQEGAVPETEAAKAAGRAFAAGEAVAEQAAGLDDSALRTALRGAIEQAQEDIADAKATLTAFGYGEGAGSGAPINPGVAVALARKVASSDKLQRIMALAGRMMATARAKRATRSEYARSELVGIEQTGDVARLLPSELGALGDPTRSTDLLRRVVERSALGYKLRGKDKRARGPIVVGVDCSGSMEGDKDVWAKAVALTLLDAARRDHRGFGVILFNGVTVAELYAPNASEVDPNDLLKILSRSAFAGCDFDLPIVPVLDCIEHNAALRKADGILITDAVTDPRHDSKAAASMARADRIGAHLYGILIGHGSGASLKSWTHEVARIDDVSRDSAAVDLIFDHV